MTHQQLFQRFVTKYPHVLGDGRVRDWTVCSVFPMRGKPPPSYRQVATLIAISALIEETGIIPSFREINRLMKKSPQGIANHLHKLVDLGYLHRSPGIARGLTITSQGRELLEMIEEAYL